ncbi:pentapeptide repeat-containing protein [Methanocaldococcus sp. 16A]
MVKVIDKETGEIIGEFYDMFIDALKSNNKIFKLKNCIVEGDIDIIDIYERIKGDEKLKKLISKEKDNDTTIPRSTITINVYIDLSFHNVKFRGKFTMYNQKIENLEVLFIKIAFKSVNFIESTFEEDVDFRFSEIHGEVNIIDSIFIKDVIFYKSIFKKNVYFEKVNTQDNLIIKGKINFTDSIFEKNVYFIGLIVFKNKVDFNYSTFRGFVHFGNLIFEDVLDFNNSIFEKNVSFRNLNFKRKVYFSGSTFGGDVDFSYYSVFGGCAEFGNTTFEKEVNFDNAVFEEEANFKKATFKGKANFYKTKFKKKVNFDEAIFNDVADFREAEFNINDGKTDFSNTTFKNYVQFSFASFNGKVHFIHATFEKEAYFKDAEFNGEVNFGSSVFKKEVDFSYSTFNIAIFEKLTFDSIAKFTDISFDLLIFSETIFEEITFFKKKNPYKGIAIFNKVAFGNKHSKIINFPLSKTSFLMTDVSEILITEKAEETLTHKLLKFKEKGIIENELLNEIKKSLEYLESYLDLNYNIVIAEYRSLRLSFENNRTYIEASELFKKEMELIKENVNIFEKFVISIYGELSDYGESMFRPFGWMIFFIFMFPIPFLVWEYNSKGLLEHSYIEYLFDTLRAFFQLGIKDNDSLLYYWEWLIRIISLILLGSLFIAIKRKLERK